MRAGASQVRPQTWAKDDQRAVGVALGGQSVNLVARESLPAYLFPAGDQHRCSSPCRTYTKQTVDPLRDGARPEQLSWIADP